MNPLETVVFIILTGILMISDYALTVVGYRWYQQSYSQFILHENYELNPIWQNAIQKGPKKRLFNIKHLFLVGILCFLLLYIWFIVLIYHQSFTAMILELCLGMLFFVLLLVNLQHVVNIIRFRYIHKNPDRSLLSGQVSISYTFSLMQSILSGLQVIVLLLICFLLTNSIFIFGGMVGEFVVSIRFALLMRKSRN
ncbi:MAG: hypothetical protein ACFFDI_09985 [Promethearchaeota archaeon]